MIPVFDYVIYPALRSAGINYTPIKRIYTGFLFCGLALLYSAILQKFVYEESPCHDNHPSGMFAFTFKPPGAGYLTLIQHAWMRLGSLTPHPLMFGLSVDPIFFWVSLKSSRRSLASSTPSQR